ncbi:MAG: threonine synthase [candidate division KSB1 bacterium]|jgi:threonine synthase|nr:threonine synthase [candidate division KSB1 bacterium]
MKCYSTKNRSGSYSLQEAVLKGIADDGGLFMPADLPVIGHHYFASRDQISFAETSFDISQMILGSEIPANVLREIVENAFTFDIPLQQMSDEIYALELFHGPTLAFKDVGAGFLAGLLAYFNRNASRPLTILVATSGDTGSAVAHGFLNSPSIQVVILYPSGRISEFQEKQFTTLGGNVQAVEVRGSFDDCQAIVKQAFADPDLNSRLRLTSANSINIGRLIPQSFYYFHAFRQLHKPGQSLVFSVPSGNFGNITAGLLAKKMGLPVKCFIAATNINDVVPEYLDTGIYTPRKMTATISNAMDVGDPSNFRRILDLYSNRHSKIVEDIYGAVFTDSSTRQAMKEIHTRYNYLLDPHSAVGYLGLRQYLQESRCKIPGIFLATAHPAKFRETVESATGGRVAIPQRLAKALNGDKVSTPCTDRFSDFKEILYDRA